MSDSSINKKFFLMLILFCLCSLRSEHTFAHAIDGVSTTLVEQNDHRLSVRIKVSVEELQAQLKGLDPEKKFNYYLRNPFESVIQRSVVQYLSAHFLLEVNELKLQPVFQEMSWVEELKFSDHAMVEITLNYVLAEDIIKSLKITNSILLDNVSDQRNIVNIRLKDYQESIVFVRGKDSSLLKL